jgi:uncharacterized protein (DUF3820 family)
MSPRSFLQERLFCNPETRQTRSLPDDLPEGAVFTPVEEKLIRLGLDPAAHPGEVDVCASKLFGSLRRRGTTADQVIASFGQATQAARQLSAARGYVVNFGKYKGRTVGEVPPDYIRWALAKHNNLSFNLRRAMRIVLNHQRRS